MRVEAKKYLRLFLSTLRLIVTYAYFLFEFVEFVDLDTIDISFYVYSNFCTQKTILKVRKRTFTYLQHYFFRINWNYLRIKYQSHPYSEQTSTHLSKINMRVSQPLGIIFYDFN